MAPTNKNDAAEKSASYPELDIEKLHALPSQQQDLYLLTFTSDLARHVAGLDADGASANQVYVKKELFKVIGLLSPSPTRVIRNNLGNCFAGTFGKGDRKLLFESVSELTALVTSSRGAKDNASKHAAVHCLGSLLEAAGDSAVSLSSTACSSILRLIKSTQNNAGFRASLLVSLGKIVKGVGRSIEEVIARDIWKQCRALATGDKSLLVQSRSCWCLEQLFTHTPLFDNSNDYDKFQAVVWRVIDTSSPSLRRSAASCISAVYVKNFSRTPKTVPRPKRQKTAKQTSGQDEDIGHEIERSDSPAPQNTPTSLSFGLLDILRGLSLLYCRIGTNDNTRAGIAAVCIKMLKGLGADIVEEYFNQIALFFFVDLLSSPVVTKERYRLLTTRRFTKIILGDVVVRKMLGETAQINAIRFLANGILKDYPQSDAKERPESPKQMIISVLDTLGLLIELLGSAANSIAETCRSVILQIIEHPSYSVQIHASLCLKTFVSSCPQQILPAVTICMNNVNREVRQLTGPRRSPRRCLGFAFGLAAAISTLSVQPLYGSVDIYSRVFNQATAILKSSSGSDLRISSTQIQVAWILIGGLMSLGPSFVKIHLSQLLLLWRNALPKPLTKENIGQRGFLELSFLTHVRECALGSIRAFLAFNHRLLTVDVSNRLAIMFQNTTDFLNGLPARQTTEDIEKRLSPSLQLQEYDLMVRRRVFDCYTLLLQLSPPESHDSLVQSNLLTLATSCFADPETDPNESLSSTIVASSGTFESIWHVGDNSGFGVTSMVNGLDVASLKADGTLTTSHWENAQNNETLIDQIIRAPMSPSIEHDSLLLYSPEVTSAPPLSTSVVDSAINLFAAAFPFQSSRVQQGILEQIRSMQAPSGSQRNPGREMAVAVNVSAALFFALHMVGRQSMAVSEIKSVEVEKAIQELGHIYLVHADEAVRHLAARCIGRLCKNAGSEFTSREIKGLIDQIVADRDPVTRSGCAMAFGSINSEMGGMAAGFHLKNIHGILMSLASDSHPIVHYWALNSISKIADSAGLAFSGYVSATLGMLAQLYVSESHNDYSVLVGTSNSEFDSPSVTALAACLDSIINVLGPDLQDLTKERNMILTLTYQFQTEDSTLIASESLRCLENLLMYAPGHISFAPYVRQLQEKLVSDDPRIQQTALTGLYNVMRRDAEGVLSAIGPDLENELWLVLHDTYGQGIMCDIVDDWVDQSGMQKIDIWVARVQNILTRVASQTSHNRAPIARQKREPDLQDEEVAGFAAAASETAKDEPGVPSDASQELLRWQARHIAMACLNKILSAVARDISTHNESSHRASLQARVADIVKIAFSASTASVVELRIEGIQIIGKVLQIFGKVPDPDFPEATLLEQYQAQISSALTPAFAGDSSPILASEAVAVCASFISTGIVKSPERMGRILRLLQSALEDFSKESDAASIGDLKGLSSNAQVMVKLAVYSAWAELQIASNEHEYLQRVVRPHIARLTPLWLASLREYARLKFEPDISTAAASGVLNTNVDMFYQASWLNFVNAIASLIDADSELVFNALDEKQGKEKDGDNSKGHDINYRDEPVAFFFVLFGISFEALVGRSSSEEATAPSRTVEVVQSLHKILRPSVAGLAIYQEAIFSETMDILDRLVLTEGIEVQSVIVQIARNLCLSHPSARKSSRDEDDDNLSDDIDQLFELTRITVLVISRHIPGLSESHDSAARNIFTKDTAALLSTSFAALVSAAAVFPSIIRPDLHACILHVFTTVLGIPAAHDDLLPRLLPTFRRFAANLARNPQDNSGAQLRSALARLLAVLHTAQQRETPAAIPAEKNALLAGTLLLSSAGGLFVPCDPLVRRYVDELVDCLANRLTTQVAAGLTRSLLLSCTTSTAGAAEAHMASRLLPRLVAFLTLPSEVEGTDESRASVAHTLTTFASALEESRRPAALGVIVPALLQRARVEGERTWRDTSMRLVEMAQGEPASFKAVVAKGLDGEGRAFLQEVIKAGEDEDEDEGDGGDLGERGGKPSIALKMDF